MPILVYSSLMGIEPRASHMLGKGSSTEPQYAKYHSMVYHTLSICPLRTTCYERTDAPLSTRFQLVWGVFRKWNCWIMW